MRNYKGRFKVPTATRPVLFAFIIFFVLRGMLRAELENILRTPSTSYGCQKNLNKYQTTNGGANNPPTVFESYFFDALFTAVQCICVSENCQQHDSIPSWQVALQACFSGWYGECDTVAFNPQTNAALFGKSFGVQCTIEDKNLSVLGKPRFFWGAAGKLSTRRQLPQLHCPFRPICEIPQYFTPLQQFHQEVTKLREKYGSDTLVFNPGLVVSNLPRRSEKNDKFVFRVVFRLQTVSNSTIEQLKHVDSTVKWRLSRVLMCSFDMATMKFFRCFEYHLWDLDQAQNGAHTLDVLAEKRNKTGFGTFHGFQDPRIFTHKSEFYLLTAAISLASFPNRHWTWIMVLTKLHKVTSAKPESNEPDLMPAWSAPMFCMGMDTQKNWMPFSFDDTLYFITELSPLKLVRIIDIEKGEDGSRQSVPSCEEVNIEKRLSVSSATAFPDYQKYRMWPPRVHGGTPLIEMEPGLFLGVIHWPIINFLFSHGHRAYFHNFLVIKVAGLVSAELIDIPWIWTSDAFRLPMADGMMTGIQFAAGLAYENSSDTLYISFGSRDSEAHLMSISKFGQKFKDMLVHGVHGPHIGLFESR